LTELGLIQWDMYTTKKLSVSVVGWRGNWWRSQKLEYALSAEAYSNGQK